MPPKKAKQGASIIDGVDMSEMTRDKLEQFTVRVKEELDKEREERNYYQLERDKMKLYWENTRSQLEELRAEIMVKERQMEEVQEKSEEAAILHSQQAKHLQLEHLSEKCALRADAAAALRAQHSQQSQREAQLLADKRHLTEKLAEQELATKECIKKLKLAHQEEVHKMRLEFDQRIHEMKAAGDQRLQKIVSDMTLEKQNDLTELEQRKNKQIDTLLKGHDKAFAELKNYYNDITVNNLALISSLKSHIEEIQTVKKSEKIEKKSIENLKPKCEQESQLEINIQTCNRQEASMKRDNAAFITKTKLLDYLKKRHEKLKLQYEILQQKYDLVLNQKNELEETLSKKAIEIEEKAALKSALLEQHLKSKVHDD